MVNPPRGYILEQLKIQRSHVSWHRNWFIFGMPSELHRYQEKVKHDLTREGAKNLILMSRK
jgi:hypothetical protein